MITFVSLMEQGSIIGYDAEVGSEIEGILDFSNLKLDVWSDDVFTLQDPIAIPKSKGKRYPFRECTHTDSDGVIFECDSETASVSVRKDGTVESITVDGVTYIDPTIRQRVSRRTGFKTEFIEVHPRRVSFSGILWMTDFDDAEEALLDDIDTDAYVSWVKCSAQDPVSKLWSGYTYVWLYDPIGPVARSAYLADTWSDEKEDHLIPDSAPPLYDDVIHAFESMRDKCGIEEARAHYYDLVLADGNVVTLDYKTLALRPAKNQGRLRKVWLALRNQIKYFRTPQLEFEDNDIFYKALDRVTPDTTNYGEFFEGVIDAPTDLQRLSSGVGNLVMHPNGRRTARVAISELAGLYLFYLYAVKPTADDLAILRQVENTLRNFSNDMRPTIFSRQPYERGGWVGYQCLQVLLKPSVVDEMSNIDEFLDQASERGLKIGSIAAPLAREQTNRMLNDLSAAGIPTDRYHATRFLLDMVPLSFAANWMVGFNEKLDALHSGAIWRRLPVDTVCRSLKASRDRSDDIKSLMAHLGVSGSATVHSRYYARRYSNEIPDLPLPKNHPTERLTRVWDQAAALMFVRLR
jgi:hypothetical protein